MRRPPLLLVFWRANADPGFHAFKVPDTARDFDLHPDGLRIATAHYDSKARVSKMAVKEAEAK